MDILDNSSVGYERLESQWRLTGKCGNVSQSYSGSSSTATPNESASFFRVEG